MTDKTRKVPPAPAVNEGDFCELPERSVNHFCTSQDTGIVVDMEIQMGDPVDSQIIRNFMGEFKEAYRKNADYDKKSA